MKWSKLLSIWALMLTLLQVGAQDAPSNFSNPILPGFHPDPSVCRVGDDYYMVTSSFTWYPGMPIYHSKDLVNWQLIGHGLNRPMINMKGLNDNDGIWAVTIRYHKGFFYLITTASKSGGNFYITATDPRGPWSDPVWLKDAPGIDPSLFWDDDGKCYYTGNTWDFPKSWPSQCAVWMQELDLQQKKLVGERKILAYGHANNATYAEGPHIYKIGNKYLLLMAEGGASYYHAVTAHQSNAVWGPYTADKINPVLSHRHLGRDYPVQNIGHADLVQTQQGDWYSVVLGIGNIAGYNPLSRETFLCKVAFDNGTPLFNPGAGRVLDQQQRPDLPWSPFKQDPSKDDFDSTALSSHWYFVRTPGKQWYHISKSMLQVELQPETIDSLVNAAMIIKKIQHHQFEASLKLYFQAKTSNEQAGLILYRTANGYYSLMKDKTGIALYKKHLGEKELVAHLNYSQPDVYLHVKFTGLDARFSFGATPGDRLIIGGLQKLDAISDNAFNKFNGPGIGVYATSNGHVSKAKASYDWFEYKAND